LVKTIKNKYNRILKEAILIGAHSGLDDNALRVLKFSNKMYLLTSFPAIFFVIIFIAFGQFIVAFLMLLFVFTCFFAFYLNSKKKYKSSKNVAAYFPLFICFIAIYILGPKSGLEYICIAMLSIPFLFFDSWTKRIVFLAFAIILLNIGFYFSLHYPILIYQVDASSTRITTFIGATLFLILSFKIQDDISNEHIEINKGLSESYKEKNTELQRFVYAASHDLKEPLRTIGSYIQLLKRQLNGNYDSNAEEYFEFIGQGVGQMQSLLSDLLDYGKIGTDNIPFQEVDLNDLLKIVTNNLKLKIEETNATVSVHDLPIIKSNKTMMIRLFQNLIENALKFKKKDCDSKIILWQNINDNSLSLYVKDNGIGIPLEYTEKIFDIFTRLHSRAQYEGSGIGLATCYKITQILKGNLSVDSEVGKGTTFIIKFPLTVLATK